MTISLTKTEPATEPRLRPALRWGPASLVLRPGMVAIIAVLAVALFGLFCLDVAIGETDLGFGKVLEVLAGGGPADVVELTLALAREMLALGGIDADPADALADGRAMDHWKAMIRAQGGDPDAPLPRATDTETVYADRDGVLTGLDAMGVGIAAWRLGAGRARQGDPVQAGAGVQLHARVGEWVRAGSPLFTLHTDTPQALPGAVAAVTDAVTIDPDGNHGAAPPLFLDRIEA